MTLKFKRNYPLVLMLVSILSVLALTMGNQPIVSYTVNTEILPAAQLTVSDPAISNTVAGLASLSNFQSASVAAQAGLPDTTFNLVQP